MMGKRGSGMGCGDGDRDRDGRGYEEEGSMEMVEMS